MEILTFPTDAHLKSPYGPNTHSNYDYYTRLYYKYGASCNNLAEAIDAKKVEILRFMQRLNMNLWNMKGPRPTWLDDTSKFQCEGKKGRGYQY